MHVCLMITLALPVQDSAPTLPVQDDIGHQAPSTPAVQIQWSEQSAVAALNNLTSLGRRVAEGAGLDGAAGDWSSTKAPSLAPAGHAGTNRKTLGVLLYYKPGGVSRKLPLPNRQRSSFRFPHELVWYELLQEEQSLSTWLADYAEWYRKQGLTVRAKEHSEGRHATLEIDCRPRSRRVGLPSEQGYYLHRGALFSQSGTLTGHFTQVGRVIFRSESSSLRTLKLAGIAREVSRASHELSVTVRPAGVPQSLRNALLTTIRKASNVGLQRRDDETAISHHVRTAMPVWMLDALRAMDSVSSVAVNLDGLRSADSSLAWELSVKGEQKTLRRIFGAPAAKRGAALPDNGADLSLEYSGGLPDAIVQSLASVGSSGGTKTLQQSLGRWLLESRKHICLKVDLDQLTLYGTVDAQNADVLLKALVGEKQVSIGDKVISVSAGRGNVWLFRSQAGKIYFTYGEPESASATFTAMLDSDVDSRKRKPALMDFSLDVGSEEPGTVTPVRRKLIEALERAIYDQYLEYRLSSRGTWNEDRLSDILASFETPGRKLSAWAQRQWLLLVKKRDFLRSLRETKGRPSFSHWLTAGSSQLRFSIDSSGNHVRIKGEVGTSLIRAALASAFAIEARLRSFQAEDSDFRPLETRFEESLDRTLEASSELKRMMNEVRRKAAQKKKP